MATTLVEIVPHSPGWAHEFMAIARPIRKQLQALALRIDHIGSTSVPDLAAKDRIDIQLTIGSAADFALVLTELEKLGYRQSARIFSDHVPPGGPYDDSEWEKRFYNPPENQRATNLHVRIEGKANQRYALLFRDYLRAEPTVAAAYAQVKLQLARHHKHNSQAYCDIKDPVCDVISIAAQRWAKDTHWSPGQSDA